jgi:hypothetical protein
MRPASSRMLLTALRSAYSKRNGTPVPQWCMAMHCHCCKCNQFRECRVLLPPRCRARYDPSFFSSRATRRRRGGGSGSRVAPQAMRCGHVVLTKGPVLETSPASAGLFVSCSSATRRATVAETRRPPVVYPPERVPKRAPKAAFFVGATLLLPVQTNRIERVSFISSTL